MTTFRQLLDQFDSFAKTTAAKGRRFEEFCLAYFRTDPYWASKFERVWLWQDWPGRDGKVDTGVDLVAEEKGTGDLVAIQCKFYSPDATLNWSHVSTFSGSLAQAAFSSGLVVSTAGKESSTVHANLLDGHAKPVSIWRVDDFEQSRVDWDQFSIDQPGQLTLRETKTLRPHQDKAITDVLGKFDVHDRGQMVMACGTGKTFTSLRLAEQLVGAGGRVLFLVPSINLLSQTVLAWANDADVALSTFAVCSDTKAGQRGHAEDMDVNDLSFPATTDATKLLEQVDAVAGDDAMTVLLSTYQSIDVIAEAQQGGLGTFDLVICDEAHRTTGAFKEVDDQSSFTKVHHDEFVQADRRLYMTATPRVYGDQTKAKADQSEITVASMDDEDVFGPVFHELKFGDAVAQGLLTDYKVLVLAVNEDEVSSVFQQELADTDMELAIGDAAKIVGCWHGLSKRGPQFDDDSEPMQRAVAFSNTIKQSKAFTRTFPEIVNQALADRRDANAVKVETDHVDGSSNVKVRSEAIHWLEEPPGQRVCRVLSNAKCLTEGVDVPALDAVLFLQPRKSIVDVVQAVGRVMRLSEGKDFGYVILPIGVPAGIPPEQALRDNEKYKVVWQVLQALRSHDERLRAEINKIDINKNSSKINIVGIGLDGGDSPDDPGATTHANGSTQTMLDLPDLGEWRDALYARIVEKVGDRRYMETWARDIATIAAAQRTRIKTLLAHPDQNPTAVAHFDEFLTALRNNLNDGVTRDDAIDMLSQHLITRPVFEALFGGDEFTRANPVSQVMQAMLDELDEANIRQESSTLEGFYNHIQMLIGGIETAEGRQKVITELYEKFFKRALPKTAASLGIVYTPIEIVDFINRAVNDLLAEHFNGATLSDKGVHILDPFTGTGTFIARLLQSGLIRPDDLHRKYTAELHANEIMLLAYYIAAINIETVHQAHTEGDEYTPFDGIVLTDTFQLSEDGDPMDTYYFPANNERADRQQGLDIRVIVGNPPYSAGQTSQNDFNQNQTYPTLDATIANTYADKSTAKLKNSLYDSYLRAIRWASNRLHTSPNGGIIGYVTNGGWIDGNTADGVRATLTDEFHHIYVFNLRGNARTSGERRRRERDNVFGSGSKTTIAITLLVKQPGQVEPGSGQIHYRDIGDYLDRNQKLETIDQATVASLDWEPIEPNEAHDWINQRDDRYQDLLPLTGDDGLFHLETNGLKTNRDAWIYNSSQAALRKNLGRLIGYYNSQLEDFVEAHSETSESVAARQAKVKWFVDRDPTKISWNAADFRRIANGERFDLAESTVRPSLYRPFFPRHVAFDTRLNNRTYQLPRLFPPDVEANPAIILQQTGPAPFYCFATRVVSDLVVGGAGNPTKVLARWRFPTTELSDTLFGSSESRQTNVRTGPRDRLGAHVDGDISDDDAFYYVYGVLHHPNFRRAFKVNLKKEGPRVPIPDSTAMFRALRDAGEQLFQLHADYDDVEPYPLEEQWAGIAPDDGSIRLLVNSKLKYPRADGAKDKTQLVYNTHLTLAGIPPEAHKWKIGTRSGIDWIIDRWYVTTDRKSGIVNDVNQWGLEQGNPRYIIELIKKVVTVSVETAEIVDGLPALQLDLAADPTP